MRYLLTALAIFASFAVQAQLPDRAQLIADIKTLSSADFQGRKTGTSGNRKAADYISARFSQIGIDPYGESFEQEFSFEDHNQQVQKGRNLVGYIKGGTDKVIVISAHYDHVGMMDGKIYYGADDNASGVVAMLAFADYFSRNPPENTLIFIAFDAEESGLKGAYAFLKQLPVERKRIKLNINMDMISRSDKNEIYASGTHQNPQLKNAVEQAGKESKVNILFGHDLPGSGKDDWTMQSDQGAFAAAGIPFIYFGVEDHKDYHQPSDTFDNIDQEFYYGASAAILKSIINLDQQTAKD